MKKNKYVCCWFCENLVEHEGMVALLHLDFPRCFVLIPDSDEFYLTDFDGFMKIAKVNWLDPSDKGTPKERQEVLELLYNFSVEQEICEENMAELNEEDFE